MVNVDNVMNVVGAYEGSKSMHVHDSFQLGNKREISFEFNFM